MMFSSVLGFRQLQSIAICTLFICCFLSYMTVRNRRIALWLRKFDHNEGAPRPLAKAISTLLCGYATLATLQDSKIRSSPEHLMGANPLLFFAFIPVAATPIASVWYLLDMVDQWMPELIDDFHWIVIAIMVGSVVASIWLAIWFVRWAGCHRAKGRRGAKRVQRFIRMKRWFGGSPFGVGVFQCDTESWKECVLLAANTCEIAFIDVSKVTSHIEWEIHTIFAILPPERIILMAATGGSDVLFPSTAIDDVARIAGPYSALRCNKITYPISHNEEWHITNDMPRIREDFEFVVGLSIGRAEQLRQSRQP